MHSLHRCATIVVDWTLLNGRHARSVVEFEFTAIGADGGAGLASEGTVTEGLFAWVFGLGILVGCAVWLGSKAA